MLKRILIAAAAVALSAAAAFAQTGFPTADNKNTAPVSVAMCITAAGVASPCQHPFAFTSISNSSGNVAAATATSTLAAAAGKLTYLCGFVASGAGATAVGAVNVTVTNVVGGTMTFVFAVPAGVDAPAQGLNLPFYPCIPTTAVNTTIVVSMPSLGAGNLHAAMVAWGFQQ